MTQRACSHHTYNAMIGDLVKFFFLQVFKICWLWYTMAPVCLEYHAPAALPCRQAASPSPMYCVYLEATWSIQLCEAEQCLPCSPTWCSDSSVPNVVQVQVGTWNSILIQVRNWHNWHAEGRGLWQLQSHCMPDETRWLILVIAIVMELILQY
jgi:hypothetical protein